nr:SPFH domain-containing protein [Cellulosimicrobium sp. MM]
MSFMEKLRGQLIDIVEFLDESRDTIVWRFPRQGNEIKNQAKLVVREGQSAVFVSEGRLADVFGPGTYTLETKNLPILSTLQGWKHGFNSPFKAEVYFVTTRQLTDLTWGTQNPVILRDPELGAVRLRAFGTYALQVVDPAALLRQLVGTDPQFRTDEIGDYFRRLVVGQLGPALAEAGVAAVDLAANQGQIATRLAGQLSEDLSEYGIAVRRFVLENVSFPPEVEAALDKRTQMAVVGNLDQYTRFQAANAIETAAGNTGGAGDGLGLGAGMGLGAAMGQQLAQSLGTPSAPQAPAAPAGPPPLPAAESPWYWAVDGAQAGPGTTADLAGHVRSGALTRGSLVWQQGMDAWTPAGQVPGARAAVRRDPAAAAADGHPDRHLQRPGGGLTVSDTQGELVRTRCDACGSQLAYAPGTQHLRCVACGGTVDIVHAAGDAVDEHSFDAWAAAQGGVRAGLLDARTLVCDGCGATTQGTDLSVACRFCGGHLVVAAEADGLVQPEAVVPFGVEQAQAREAFRRMGALALVRARRAEEGGGHRVAARLVRAALDVRRAHVVRVHGPARRRVLRHREAGGRGAPGAARELDVRRGARRARLRRRARARVVPGCRARPRAARAVAARAGRALPRRVPRRVRGGALRGRAARRARAGSAADGARDPAGRRARHRRRRAAGGVGPHRVRRRDVQARAPAAVGRDVRLRGQAVAGDGQREHGTGGRAASPTASARSCSRSSRACSWSPRSSGGTCARRRELVSPGARRTRAGTPTPRRPRPRGRR